MPQPKDGPMPGFIRVRLSIRPWEETDVPEAEVPVLRQQGLLAEDEPAVPAEPKAPAGKPGKDAS